MLHVYMCIEKNRTTTQCSISSRLAPTHYAAATHHGTRAPTSSRHDVAVARAGTSDATVQGTCTRRAYVLLLTCDSQQAQEASLSASVTAMTDPGTGLAEARRLSCVCRDGLSALRGSVDAFDLSLATEEALEPHAPAVLAAKEELRRMRVAHDGWVDTCGDSVNGVR